MKQKTLRQNKYKDNLEKLYAKYPEAKEVKNRYRSMRALLQREYISLQGIDNKVLEDILKDTVYIDRLIRRATEGLEDEEKTILSQDFQLNTLPEM